MTRDTAASPAPTWTVVCLCAGWCGVCREYRAVFDALAAAHPQVRFDWVDVEDEEALSLLPGVPPQWVDAERQFEYEAVIGVVRLVDVHDASWCGEDQYGRPLEMCSPWALRSFLHLVLTDPHPLPQPIPRIGRLGLGLARPDRHLVEKVCEQLPFL